MFNVGTGELVLILLLALIVLGPDKLPSVARQVGHYMAEFRRLSGGFQREFRDAMDAALATPPDDTKDEEDAGTGSFSLPVIDGREAEAGEVGSPLPGPAVVAPDAERGSPGSDTLAPESSAAPGFEGGGPDVTNADPEPAAEPSLDGPRLMVYGPSSSFR